MNKRFISVIAILGIVVTGGSVLALREGNSVATVNVTTESFIYTDETDGKEVYAVTEEVADKVVKATENTKKENQKKYEKKYIATKSQEKAGKNTDNQSKTTELTTEESKEDTTEKSNEDKNQIPHNDPIDATTEVPSESPTEAPTEATTEQPVKPEKTKVWVPDRYEKVWVVDEPAKVEKVPRYEEVPFMQCNVCKAKFYSVCELDIHFGVGTGPCGPASWSDGWDYNIVGYDEVVTEEKGHYEDRLVEPGHWEYQ